MEDGGWRCIEMRDNRNYILWVPCARAWRSMCICMEVHVQVHGCSLWCIIRCMEVHVQIWRCMGVHIGAEAELVRCMEVQGGELCRCQVEVHGGAGRGVCWCMEVYGGA